MTTLEIPNAGAFDRDVLNRPEPTVVAFWAEWCPFCRSFRPIFEAHANDARARFAIVRLDDEDNPLWERYDVRVVPSVAYFHQGKLVSRRDGRLGRGLSVDDLEAFLREVHSPSSIGQFPHG